MYSLIPQIEALLRNGDLLPSIRKPSITRDVTDYFDKRVDETAPFINSIVSKIPALASTIALPSQKPIAKNLDAIGSIAYVDVGSVEKLFRELWLNDTLDNRNPNSISNLLFIISRPETRRKTITQLREVVRENYFSRATLAKVIYDIPAPSYAKQIVMQRASDLYLSANALSCGSDLLNTKRSFFNGLAQPNNNFLGPLSSANVNLFLRVAELSGIPPKIFRSLSAEDIILLKYTPEFASFKDYYFELVKSVVIDEQHFLDELWQKHSNNIKKEQFKKRFLAFVKYLGIISSLLFAASLESSLQNFQHTTQILLLGSGAVSATSHIIEKAAWFQNAPITAFITYMTKNKYKLNLKKNSF